MTDHGVETVYEWAGPPSLRLERWQLGSSDPGRYMHRMVVQEGRPGVVIVPRDQDSGHLLFVLVRRGEGEPLLELPRGFGEAEDGPAGGEPTARAAASRELAEETGLIGERIRRLGQIVADSSLLPGTVDVLAATVQRGSEAERTDDAIADIVWLSPAQVRAAIREGRFGDSLTLAALAFWLAD